MSVVRERILAKFDERSKKRIFWSSELCDDEKK